MMEENIFKKTRKGLTKVRTGIINWFAKPDAQDELINQAWHVKRLSEIDDCAELTEERIKYDDMKKAFIDRFERVDELYTNLLHCLEYSVKSNIYRRNIQRIVKWDEAK